MITKEYLDTLLAELHHGFFDGFFDSDQEDLLAAINLLTAIDEDIKEQDFEKAYKNIFEDIHEESHLTALRMLAAINISSYNYSDTNVANFFEYLEKNYPDKIPLIKEAFFLEAKHSPIEFLNSGNYKIIKKSIPELLDDTEFLEAIKTEIKKGKSSAYTNIKKYFDHFNATQKQEIIEALVKADPKYILSNPNDFDSNTRSAAETQLINNFKKDAFTHAQDITSVLNARHELNSRLQSDSNENSRFHIIQNFSASEIFKLIAESYDPYTSTAQGLMDRILHRAGHDFDFITKMKDEQLIAFANTTAGFNLFGKFLDKLAGEDPDSTLKFVQKLFEKSKSDSKALTTLANIIENLPNKDYLREEIINLIQSNYQNAVNENINQMRIIATIAIQHLGDKLSPTQLESLNKISSGLKLADLSTIDSSTLYSRNTNTINQIHVFYGDQDGKMSYNTFSNALRTQGYRNEYSEENTEIWVKSQNGITLKIHISKPSADSDGDTLDKTDVAENVKKIRASITAKSQTVGAIFFRGHSYNVEKNLDEIQPTDKIVFLGSCGGATNITSVLKSSPAAHIFSTAGTGTAIINNELILRINELLLKSGEQSWESINTWLNTLKREEAVEYITPDKNTTALILMKLEELKAQNAQGLRGVYTPQATGTPPPTQASRGQEQGAGNANLRPRPERIDR